MGSITTRVYWFKSLALSLKLELLFVAGGVTWHKTTARTEYSAINERTSSSMSELTTSGEVRTKSFFTISRMTISGDILVITPISIFLNFGTVRPPTPCINISAVPCRSKFLAARSSKRACRSDHCEVDAQMSGPKSVP